MAYPSRPMYNPTSPSQETQPRPSPWANYQRYPIKKSGTAPRIIPGIMDPESEESDVSAAEDDPGTFALPVSLSPSPSKQALENQQTIQHRLDELDRYESYNISKHNGLRSKRLRMDERIAHKRAIQDDMMTAIMAARGRRDSKIKQRRDREDIAFQSFYEDVEEEESRLRQRLKRLKRGLPVEDGNASGSRRTSMNSAMSPNATPYSTVPPPAKRRRLSQADHPEALNNRLPNMPQHQPPPPERPPYHYYQQSGPPPPQTPYPNAPLHHAQHQSTLPSPTVTNHNRPATEMAAYPQNGYHNSPHMSGSHSLAHSITPNQTVRPPMSSYDTRPPPPMSSGFAAVNQPPHGGFAAVNSRPVVTPPALATQLSRESANNSTFTPADETPVRPALEEKNSSGSGATNKRTPSTTHPYQMSEAFANRHHHCERTDSINRGVWTWFGPGGTQDRPTAPPTEMYLKCNHDNCGRIDWRTVHGLQCHIVKNHEQPKGTIGSLEKALAAYGVPVRDIEEIEKRDGLGSGGTMADPKNTKIRAKVRESGDRRDLGGRDTPVSMAGTPTLNKQQQSTNSGSPVVGSVHPSDNERRLFTSNDQRLEGTQTSPIEVDKPPTFRAASGFAAVNSGWANVNPRLSPMPAAPARNLPMHDAVPTDRKSEATLEGPRSPHRPGNFWSGWGTTPRYPPTTKPPHPPPPEPISHPTPEPVSRSSDQQSAYIASETVELETNKILPNAPAIDKKAGPEQDLPVESSTSMKDNDRFSNVRTTEILVEQGHRRSPQVDKPGDDSGMTDALPTPVVATNPSTEPESMDSRVTITETHVAKELSHVDNTLAEIKATEAPEMPVVAVKPLTEQDSTTVYPEEQPADTPTERQWGFAKDSARAVRNIPVSSREIVEKRERASRRASIVTTASNKLKGEDDESTAAKAVMENMTEDDGDTIEVDSTASRPDPRDRDTTTDDRTTPPPKRLPNGRFTRRAQRAREQRDH